jgi:hypothetical protein
VEFQIQILQILVGCWTWNLVVKHIWSSLLETSLRR